MSHIVPMLLNEMQTHLENQLITLVPSNDPYRLGLVKVGRFQEDPTKTISYVALQPGDPEDTNWKDGIVTVEQMENVGLNLYAREIGGGELWWRRFTASIGCYWLQDRLEEDEAMEASYMIMGRLCSAIPQLNVGGLVDDFSEIAQFTILYATTFFQGGGPKKYIWRGKVMWQVLTERP